MNTTPVPPPPSDEALVIIRRLTCSSEPASERALLARLNSLHGDRLRLSLPPMYDGEPFSISDAVTIQAWLDRGIMPAPSYAPSEGAVLRHGAQVLGALVAAPGPPMPAPQLEHLAQEIGALLGHWRQQRLEHRLQTEKETLVRLCRAANAQPELSAVLAEAFEALRNTLPFDTFVATVYDPATEMNVLSYSVDGTERYIDNLVGPVPNSLQGYLLRSRVPLQFADLYTEISAYPEIQVIRFGSGTPMRSWLGVPLLLGDGRAVGVLSVQHGTAALYTQRDRLFLEQVAVPVAIAIEKAMLLLQRDREIAVLTAQTELSEALGHAHDVQTALESGLTAISESFPGHAYLMYVLDEQQRVEASILQENAVVYRQEGVGKQFAPGSLSDFIMEQPKPVLFQSEQAMIEAGIVWNNVGDPDQPPTETVIGAALHASDGSRMGLISVQSYNRNAFDQRQAALLGSIARQVALVVENARLIERDQQRLAALEQANRELELAQHRAIEAERRRAIGDIAAGVAHDFNNLLGSILGNAQLIGMTRSLADAQEMAGMIEIAARDAATIVRRIQEFTRARSAVERTPIDVHMLLHTAVDISRPKWRDEAQLRGITVTLQCEREPVDPVLGVESELREVLVNLIVNSVDALAKDGTITLGCRQHDQQVDIFVRDTGSGMRPETLARAGQPFFTTKGSDGSGLGLAVSQGIVQRHGGELVLASVEGEGTTVTLQLPAAPLEQAKSEPSPRAHGRGAAVVLVEDDPDLRSVTKRLMEWAGHVVHAFDAGPAALAHLRDHHADLLLTDLGLPGMSGWEVAREAQALQPALRVLMVTGWGDRVAPQDAERHGVSAVLSKPLEHRELLDTIQQALQTGTMTAL